MIATLGRAASSPYFGVADLRTYDVWGSVRSGSTTGDPKQRYCANLGHIQDDESGLIYMRARYYEPWSGRFVSEDPARDGWNWFLYAKSNPSTFIDSDGREALAIGYNIIGNLLIAIGRMYIRGLPGDADGVLKYVAERLTDLVVDQLPPEMAEAIRGLLKWYRALKTAFQLAKGGDVFNANKAITAIAGYTIACYGMLYIIDSEQMGGGGDWFAFD
ncbi:MAG: hypothetical protein BroJett009_16900 [Armatimonadota bacterium]|nr:MAG: hypothetical protein BroJett009_16900 [Armatimonadota bacterium]